MYDWFVANDTDDCMSAPSSTKSIAGASGDALIVRMRERLCGAFESLHAITSAAATRIPPTWDFWNIVVLLFASWRRRPCRPRLGFERSVSELTGRRTVP